MDTTLITTMDIIRDVIMHQSNGSKGLRIAASVLVVLGWCELIVCCFLALYNLFNNAPAEVIFGLLLSGGIGLLIMYLIACSIRGFASLVEAAQLYWDNNAPVAEN